MKAKMAGKPNWWHSQTASPITDEVTQKITQKTIFEPKNTNGKFKETKITNTNLKNEFTENCALAENFKKTQTNDGQM